MGKLSTAWLRVHSDCSAWLLMSYRPAPPLALSSSDSNNQAGDKSQRSKEVNYSHNMAFDQPLTSIQNSKYQFVRFLVLEKYNIKNRFLVLERYNIKIKFKKYSTCSISLSICHASFIKKSRSTFVCTQTQLPAVLSWWHLSIATELSYSYKF